MSGKLKKQLAIGLVVILVMSVMGFGIGNIYLSENGSFSEVSIAEDDTIEIENWYDLDDVRNDLDADYVLINDLDEDTDGYDELVDTEEGWHPIGDKDDPFRGEFDGQGNVISDLYIDKDDPQRVGLIGATNESEINDVGLEDIDIDGSLATGGLVGLHRWNSKIKNSYVTGAIKNGTGGLVGGNFHSEIQDSYAEVDVIGNTQVGGLVGSNVLSIIRNSYAKGDVEGKREIGGLVGVNRVESEIHNSYATGDVKAEIEESAESRVKASQVGGLVGWNKVDSTVSNSYATGNVSGESQVGGLLGTNLETVSDSYATGDVSGNSTVGGLIGRNQNGDASSSYATGRVTAEENGGGLIGLNKGTVESSYADESSTGQTELVGDEAKGTTQGCELLMTEDMIGSAAEENMEDFDFDEIWKTVEGDQDNAVEDGYPILQGCDKKEQLNAQGLYEEAENEIPGFTSVIILLGGLIATAIYNKEE